MEIKRNTLLFLALLTILLIGSVFMQEGFEDASGEYVRVSLRDLMSILGMATQKNTVSAPEPVSKESVHNLEGKESGTSDMYASIKDDLLKEVRTTVRSSIQEKQEGSVLSDSCIDSISNQQGTDWMRYIPGKNPADYIRKDSIPCYACKLD